MRILLIEDSVAVARVIARGLRGDGHEVDVAADLARAREALAAPFDVLLVDRVLPDGDGLDLIRERRGAGDRTPAICVTSRDPVRDRVEGLEAGADDYLVKPFAIEELLARVHAVRRRAVLAEATPPAEDLRVADLRVDVRAHRAWRGADELPLTPQEFRLLLVLTQHAGRVLSRRDLLVRVWGTHHDPGTNVVDVYVRYLRQKLERPGLPSLIHTVRGVGYVLEETPR